MGLDPSSYSTLLLNRTLDVELDRKIPRRQKYLYTKTYRISNYEMGLCQHCPNVREQPDRTLCNSCLRKHAANRMKNYQHKLGPRIHKAPAEVLAVLNRLYGFKLHYSAVEVAAAFGVSAQTIRMNATKHLLKSNSKTSSNKPTHGSNLSKRSTGGRGVFVFTTDDVTRLCSHVAIQTTLAKD